MASTADLYPDGIGSNDAWTLGAGASKVAAVASNDGDTTYIYGVNNQRQYFTFANVPGEAQDPVLTAQVRAEVRKENTSPTLFIYNGSAEVNKGTATDTYQTFTENFYSLAVANINAGEIGLFASAGGGEPNRLRCTELFTRVTYEPIPGGFAFLIACFLGALSGVVMSEMPKLARELERRSSTWLVRRRFGPEDHLRMFRELREYRFQRHFDLAVR